MSGANDTRTENRRIQQIIRHPEYSASTKKNDIALIKVSRRIHFTDDIRPACLQTDQRDVDQSVKLIVSGWGRVSQNCESQIDQKIGFSIASLFSSKLI